MQACELERPSEDMVGGIINKVSTFLIFFWHKQTYFQGECKDKTKASRLPFFPQDVYLFELLLRGAFCYKK
jgi:hypothetical protein